MRYSARSLASYYREMASGGGQTLISVRGEARRTVTPDLASLYSKVTQIADSKSAATAAAGARVTELLAEFAELGAQALTVQTTRSPVTWSMHSIQTHEQYADKRTGEHGPTGRHVATANVVVSVRDFALLNAVSGVLTSRDEADLHSVSRSVDEDNPEWALVRADAIHAALLKGQDYASALGGSIVAVEHVADAGLLGGETSGHIGWRQSGSFAEGVAGESSGGLSMDPVRKCSARPSKHASVRSSGPYLSGDPSGDIRSVASDRARADVGASRVAPELRLSTTR